MYENRYDPRVLTVRRSKKSDDLLPLGVPVGYVVLTNWFDLDKIIHPIDALKNLFKIKNKILSENKIPTAALQIKGASYLNLLKSKLSKHYNSFFLWPDKCNGWIPYALGAGIKLIKSWKPDYIFTSAPSHSVVLVGYLLSKIYRIPWIAEFRDRWSEDPYQTLPKWRSCIDRYIERKLLKQAFAIVTVSDPWADEYKRKYKKPVLVVYNGFNEPDFPLDPKPLPLIDKHFNFKTLNILYVGSIYAGFRDPTPLFKALKSGKFDPAQVQVHFFGPNTEVLQSIVKREKVEEFVQLNGKVTFKESINLQYFADVLLLLQANHESEAGNVPGKLFEYFASLRPIIGIGYDKGIPAKLIKENKVGIYSNDPNELVVQIKEWIHEKSQSGKVIGLPLAFRSQFTRDRQFQKLADFLEEQ